MENGRTNLDDTPSSASKGGAFLLFLLRPFKKIFDFRGRSQRTEYWVYALISGQALTMTSDLLQHFFGVPDERFLSGMIAIAIFQIPFTALLVRRFHEMGTSGWWTLPIFASIALAFWATATYGGSPRLLFNALDELKPTLGAWLVVVQWGTPLALLAIGIIPPTKDREAFGGHPRF